MRFEKPISSGDKILKISEFIPVIDNVLANSDMFELPNKSKLTSGKFKTTVKSLLEQYINVIQYDIEKPEKKKEIDILFEKPHRKEFWIKRIKQLLDKAPGESAPVIASNLWRLPEEIREEIIRLLLEKYPEESASEIANNLELLPEGIREEIIRLLLEKYPEESASEIASRSYCFPKEKQKELILLLLEKYPEKTASRIADNLKYLPEEIEVKIDNILTKKYHRKEIAYLLLEKYPEETISGIANNLEFLPEEIQYEIRNKLPIIEKENIVKSENINPILYKNIENLEKQFSKKEFIKTDTRTILLGGPFINNVILRIIPNKAFISWMKAYSSVEIWKEAGFNYIPIEPILRAFLCEDKNNVRVYAGVLGMSVAKYLEMHLNNEFHEHVKQQVDTITKTLANMGIEHGHPHYYNFCVLHERTPEGEIDFSKPPRVYCIDFDQSISK